MRRCQIAVLLAAGLGTAAYAQRSDFTTRGPSGLRPTSLTARTQPSGSSSRSGQELYVSTRTGEIYRIDSYASAPTASLVTATPTMGLSDIAVDPTDGAMYGIAWISSASGRELLEIDLTNGAVAVVGTLPDTANNLDFTPDGRLFIRGITGRTWEIDATTASGVIVAQGGSRPAGDLAWEAEGTLLVSTAAGDIERTDPSAGTNTVLFDTGLGSSVYGLEIDVDGMVYLGVANGGIYRADLNATTVSLLGNLSLSSDLFGLAFARGPGAAPLGLAYCGPAVSNSTGSPGAISAEGSSSAAVDRVELTSSSLPVNASAFFLTSRMQGTVVNPGGSTGVLCLGGAIGRYVGSGQVQNAGSSGVIRLTLELSMTPTPTGFVSIQPGETWNFTAWYRDNLGGQATSNFTDAVAIAFL